MKYGAGLKMADLEVLPDSGKQGRERLLAILDSERFRLRGHAPALDCLGASKSSQRSALSAAMHPNADAVIA